MNQILCNTPIINKKALPIKERQSSLTKTPHTHTHTIRMKTKAKKKNCIEVTRINLKNKSLYSEVNNYLYKIAINKE